MGNRGDFTVIVSNSDATMRAHTAKLTVALLVHQAGERLGTIALDQFRSPRQEGLRRSPALAWISSAGIRRMG